MSRMKKCAGITAVAMAGVLAVTGALPGTMQTAQAAPFESSATYSITPNGTWTTGTITNRLGQTNYYPVTLKSAGRLKIQYQARSLENSRVSLVNQSDTKTYFRDDVLNSDSSNPKTVTETMVLEAGTYYIKVESLPVLTSGDYALSVSYDAINSTVTGANNSFETAYPLTDGKKVNGLLTEDEKADFYRFTLSKTKTVKIAFSSSIEAVQLNLWDANRTHQENSWSTDVLRGSESNPQSVTKEYKLKAGTYFVSVNKYQLQDDLNRVRRLLNQDKIDSTGRYSLTVSPKVMVSKISISNNKKVTPGKKFTLKAKITPSNAENKTVLWSQNSLTEAALVNPLNGEVAAVHPGKARIKCEAQDGSNVSKSVTVIVKPLKENIYTIYSPKKKQLYVSYSSQTNISSYQIQYAGNKKMKHAKTVRVGKSTVTKTIKKVSSGRKYVRVRAGVKVGKKTYYGSWSAKRGVHVK